MGEFFHGWRRKIGVVMLVLACATMVGWVRSDPRISRLSWSCVTFDKQDYHQFTLTENGVEWTKERCDSWKNYKTWLVPYEAIVYPLTLFSAFLLFGSLRVAKTE